MDKKRRYASAQFGADNPALSGAETDLHEALFGDLSEDLSEVDPSELLLAYALPDPEMEDVDPTRPDPTPLEQQAVRTTIVGGRPPGSGKPIGEVPRGIEVLVKKASVDPDFKTRLMDDPLAAADEIELQLEPVERMMLQAVTQAQLEAIIRATEVPEAHRRAFLGRTAAAMLIVLGGQAAGTAGVFAAPGGAAPDFPDDPAPPAPLDPYAKDFTAQVVRATLGTVMNIDPQTLPDAPFVDKRFSENAQLRFRMMIGQNKNFLAYITPAQLKRWRTVGDAVQYIDRAKMCQRPVIVLTAKLAGVKPSGGLSDKTLEDDLKLSAADRASLRRALASTLRVYIPWETFKNLRTVDDVVFYVGGLALAVKLQREKATGQTPGYQPGSGTFGNKPDYPPASRGIRPDTPPMSFGIRPDGGPQ